jgi:hypothetical protein
MFDNNFNILLITDVMLHKVRNTNVRINASCENVSTAIYVPRYYT